MSTVAGDKWHLDEVVIPINGRKYWLWRAGGANGDVLDILVQLQRNAKAAKAFLNKAIERVRFHRPVSICTDKAPTYRKVIREINHAYDPHFDSITHIDRKYLNKRIESDHAALKRFLGYRQIFRSLRSAKATLAGMETIRSIKRGHIHNKIPSVRGEIEFMHQLFQVAA